MTALPLGLRPRGLPWSVLTTNRTVLRIYLACLALGGVTLLAAYTFGGRLGDALAACGVPDPPCTVDVIRARGAYEFLTGFVGGAIAYFPVAVAAFAGAALVGRELENGTASLAWTQSLSPARWLATRLAVPAVLLVAGMAVLTPLYRWVFLSGHSPNPPSWFKGEGFLAGGPTGTAYVLFGLVLGATVGLLVRRTLVALTVAAVVTGLTQALGHVYRPDLWPVVTRTGPWRETYPSIDAQIVERGGITPSGERFDLATCFEGPVPPTNGISECFAQRDAQSYVDFHPASHYWPLQLVETGIVLGLAAGLTAAAFWLLRRRLP